MSEGRMTERQAIIIAAILGGAVLVLVMVALHPFSWGREMEIAVTGSAVSGEAVGGSKVFYGPVRGGAVTGAAVKGTMTVGNGTIMNPGGTTLAARINPPKGFFRTAEEKGSLGEFLRNYDLKKDGAKVKLYDGSDKANQDAHAAVFKLPLEKENLQQCADTVIRVYAEYMWEKKMYDQISFQFVDGFQAEYTKWREGWRIQVGAGATTWTENGPYDDSYENFKKYLRMVFAYSSTLSLKNECKKTKLSNIEIGDIFLQGGSPGHTVIVVDMAENAEGKKAFLLGQGFMPAQQFHVLKNPAHIENPWYYLEEIRYPMETPEYNFQKGTLMHPKYLD